MVIETIQTYHCYQKTHSLGKEYTVKQIFKYSDVSERTELQEIVYLKKLGYVSQTRKSEPCVEE